MTTEFMTRPAPQGRRSIPHYILVQRLEGWARAVAEEAMTLSGWAYDHLTRCWTAPEQDGQ